MGTSYGDLKKQEIIRIINKNNNYKNGQSI